MIPQQADELYPDESWFQCAHHEGCEYHLGQGLQNCLARLHHRQHKDVRLHITPWINCSVPHNAYRNNNCAWELFQYAWLRCVYDTHTSYLKQHGLTSLIRSRCQLKTVTEQWHIAICNQGLPFREVWKIQINRCRKASQKNRSTNLYIRLCQHKVFTRWTCTPIIILASQQLWSKLLHSKYVQLHSQDCYSWPAGSCVCLLVLHLAIKWYHHGGN